MSRLTLEKFQIAYHSKHWPVCRKMHPSQPLQKPCLARSTALRSLSSFSINLGLLVQLKFSVLALLLETNWLVLCSGQTAACSLSSTLYRKWGEKSYVTLGTKPLYRLILNLMLSPHRNINKTTIMTKYPRFIF